MIGSSPEVQWLGPLQGARVGSRGNKIPKGTRRSQNTHTDYKMTVLAEGITDEMKASK